ncbi:flagellar hook-basal body complex protein FliE [[Clostridium] colinum]|uniref:flagellar hook-basal body complex protein FliE n=1 Tax=[Clostridium] colinum TaxID=36835 RepID=UPI0020242DD2|nr:flagellar hook-basal body complex protein FliE [[Clostridium] colinum]
MRIDNNIQAFNKTLTFNTENNESQTSRIDSFGKFFDEAVNLIEETNVMQKDVEQKQIDFITGKSDDMISLIMAQSRAGSAIQFTSQVTSKILNAYQEIMRIPI